MIPSAVIGGAVVATSKQRRMFHNKITAKKEGNYVHCSHANNEGIYMYICT